MFSILKRSRQPYLSIDLQLHLFNAVLPLYGCDVWAPEDCVILEKLQLRFCKYILSVIHTITWYMEYWVSSPSRYTSNVEPYVFGPV